MTKQLGMYRCMLLLYITIFRRKKARQVFYKTSRLSRACFFKMGWYDHCKLTSELEIYHIAPASKKAGLEKHMDNKNSRAQKMCAGEAIGNAD
jgi:hypothetical protein